MHSALANSAVNGHLRFQHAGATIGTLDLHKIIHGNGTLESGSANEIRAEAMVKILVNLFPFSTKALVWLGWRHSVGRRHNDRRVKA